jgi:hypothetical protein
MISRLAAVIGLALVGTGQVGASDVVVRRVPNGGIKASAAVDENGKVHLIYFTGEPSGGDTWYVTSIDGGATFSRPLQVNNQPGSVLGASSSRGPRLALGKDGRVHAIWMGSSKAKPRGPLNPSMPADSPFNGTPLLYSQLDPGTGAFTPQRNLMTKTVALDGDSSITADRKGNVYVVWHAQSPEGKGEKDRGIWIARSEDNGATFPKEKNVLPEATGVCPCCGVTAQISADGAVAILYRAATDTVSRGMRMLQSSDGAETFKLSSVDEWKLSMCPMSTASILGTSKGFLGAWENNGKIGFGYLGQNSSRQLSDKLPRKHPVLATNHKGETLLAWTEGIGFGKGGGVGWQLFDDAGQATGAPQHAEGLSGHGYVAAIAMADGTFVVIY